MSQPKYPLRYMRLDHPLAKMLGQFPNFGPYGNLTGMRLNFGWQHARPVKCGAYIANVDERTYRKATAR